MTKLSVNINKIATLRNARGANNPNVIQVAKDCEKFGAQGITVHPRPDERHITEKDALELANVVTTEYNIEGFPDDRFIEIIRKTQPTQATLVPDTPEVLTSNSGWDTIGRADELKRAIEELNKIGVRVSVFVDPHVDMIQGAYDCGADRIELYTEPYASGYISDKRSAISKYKIAAKKAQEIGLGINAGHDLDLNNLQFLKSSIPYMKEVSIGHALVCDALYFGLENTIQLYLEKLK